MENLNNYQQSLQKVRSIVGTFEKVGSQCGVSGAAVRKWFYSGRPPRTEYSGETNYAVTLERATGGIVKADQLRPVIKRELSE